MVNKSGVNILKPGVKKCAFTMQLLYLFTSAPADLTLNEVNELLICQIPSLKIKLKYMHIVYNDYLIIYVIWFNNLYSEWN